MDLRQLTALVAVAEHRTFSAAARALHTVQSNVSTHVARLERELGATLIDRTNGSLTPEGEAVVARARRIHTELQALLADVESVRSEVSGSVRIGILGTTARWLTSQLLETAAETYPRVHVVVVDGLTTSLIPQLETDRLDLAVVALPVHDPDIEAEPLFAEDLVVIAPSSHPLAERDETTLAELAQYELLLEPAGTTFRDDLDRQAEAAGLRLQAKAEVDGMRLLASLALEGYGAAVLPASATPSVPSEGWKRVPITGASGRSVGLAWRRRRLLPAPTRALREVLLRVVKERAANQPGIHPAPTL